MGENLEGVGRQKLIVPAVPPRTVGLDPAQPLQVEQVAGSVDDIEARSPTPIGPVGLPGPGASVREYHRRDRRQRPGRPGQETTTSKSIPSARSVLAACPHGSS